MFAIFDTESTGLNITTVTTTLVKSGTSIVDSLIINTAAASAVIKIYDDVSAVAGSLKATITMPAVLLASQIQLNYKIKCNKGITIVTSVAAQDITVAYR